MKAGSWSASPLRLTLIAGCSLAILLVGNIHSATASERGGVAAPLPQRNLFLRDPKITPPDAGPPASLATEKTEPAVETEEARPHVKSEATTSLVTLTQAPGDPPVT